MYIPELRLLMAIIQKLTIEMRIRLQKVATCVLRKVVVGPKNLKQLEDISIASSLVEEEDFTSLYKKFYAWVYSKSKFFNKKEVIRVCFKT